MIKQNETLRKTAERTLSRFVTVQLPSAKDGVGHALAVAYGGKSQPLPDDMLGMLAKLDRR